MDSGPSLDVVTRWIQLLGAALFLGALAIRFRVLPVLGRRGALPELRTRMRAGLRLHGWIAVVLLATALILRLAVRIAQVEGGSGVGDVAGMLFRSAWGAGWWLHLAVVAIGGIGLTLTAPRGLGDRGWQILAGAAVLLPLAFVLQGHGWEDPSVRAVTAPAMYLHVAGSAVWLGGLLLLLAVGLPAVRATPAPAEEALGDPDAVPTLARLVNAFSALALPAVGVVVLTGVLDNWFLSGSPANLVSTDWGRTLLVKLAVVAAAFLLGFHNWRKVRPELAANPDPGRLRIPALVEAALGVSVLLVTALLGTLPLP